MSNGTVKFFNETKGFGFIVDSETGEEFFVHVTELNWLQIKENDVVNFEVAEGKKWMMAVEVSKA